MCPWLVQRSAEHYILNVLHGPQKASSKHEKPLEEWFNCTQHNENTCGAIEAQPYNNLLNSYCSLLLQREGGKSGMYYKQYFRCVTENTDPKKWILWKHSWKRVFFLSDLCESVMKILNDALVWIFFADLRKVMFCSLQPRCLYQCDYISCMWQTVLLVN